MSDTSTRSFKAILVITAFIFAVIVAAFASPAFAQDAPQPTDKISSPSITVTNVGEATAPATEFRITCTPAGENPAGGTHGVNTTRVVSSDVVCEAPFGKNVYFTEEGDYRFIYGETKGIATGWTYDTTTYYWELTVVEHDGKLVITKNKLSADDSDKAETTACFENSYKTPGATFDFPEVAVGTSGHDVLTERNFVMQIAGEGYDEPAQIAVGGGKEADFGSVTFAREGSYEYAVQELEGGEEGVDYDTSLYTLEVKVTDNDGDLSASLASVKKDEKSVGTTQELAVANDYTAPVTAKTPAVTLTVDNGDKMPSEREFLFTMTPKDYVGPMPAESSIYIETKTGGSKDFGLLTFEPSATEQTYVYEVKQGPSAFPYVSSDTTTYTVTYTVKDDKVSQSITDSHGAVVKKMDFVNAYKPPTTKAEIAVAKQINYDGDDERSLNRVIDGSDDFTFRLEALTEDAPMPADSDDSVFDIVLRPSFAYDYTWFDIPFTEGNKTYKYRLTEYAASDPDAYSMDDTEYGITIAVADDCTSADVTYTRDGENFGSSTLTFTNDLDFHNYGPAVASSATPSAAAASPAVASGAKAASAETGDSSMTPAVSLAVVASIAALMAIIAYRRRA